ncbi:glycoside hydrolase family 15 protein [uncultured Pseudokineococcus sp.]|uniref:glycoside hydrolase family 15 protein n=1 Tax=uncultured Pseudokineococcus sp. TaxID=1642928 RepID=UPI00342A4009
MRWGAAEATASEPVERDDDGYIDLRSYAAIGDGRTVALVARDGRIDWLPLPDMDSEPVFAALLDARNGGHVSLAPTEPFTVSRSYVEHTNVLATTFTTASGSARVTDALNTGIAGRLPWAELARRVEGLEGEVRLRAEISPGTCLGTASPWVQRSAHASVLRVDGLTMSVISSGEVRREDHDQHVEVEYVTSPGSRHLLGLVATEREPLFVPTADDLDAGLDRTIENWSRWTTDFYWDGPWDEAVRRSALALKLLLHSPSGAIVAAPTMALPESPAGGKNWDYRFAWVRDTAYTLRSLFRFGLREETHGAISWLLATVREHGPEPQIFYTLSGDLPPGEAERDVPGWRGVGPVTSGNGAADQLQLGVFGDLFTVVRLYVDHGNVLDADTGRMLASVADLACDRWQQRDAGMWELGEERHYTSSKLGCWEALTGAVHLAEIGQIPGDPARWRAEAERIRTWVEQEAWSEEVGAYTWYPGTDQLDASILLHALSGFDRGERMSRTIDALREQLGHGPHLYRYSGVAAEEGTFVACSFWSVAALHCVGRRAEARELMDQLVAEVPNDVGLMAEMVDPASGDFLGNLPQGLSHLALLGTAIMIADGDADGAGG